MIQLMHTKHFTHLTVDHCRAHYLDELTLPYKSHVLHQMNLTRKLLVKSDQVKKCEWFCGGLADGFADAVEPSSDVNRWPGMKGITRRGGIMHFSDLMNSMLLPAAYNACLSSEKRKTMNYLQKGNA